MRRRYRVLVSAYACEPGKGSEPGVGWNVVRELAAFHDVWVLTRANNRPHIEAELQSRPVPHLHFAYFDLPDWTRRWKRGTWGTNLYYVLWQLAALRPAQQLHRELHFDLVHHLTFNQFRTPSFGYFLNLPLVVGPIGGAETVPWCLMRDLQWSTRLKESLRKLPLDGLVLKLRNPLFHAQRFFVFSNAKTLRHVRRFLGPHEATVLPAIGVSPSEIGPLRSTTPNSSPETRNMRLIYVGRPEDWKGVRLLLTAVHLANRQLGNGHGIVLTLVGANRPAEHTRLNNLISQLGLTDKVQVIPFMKRSELLQLYSTVDLMAYPAFRDSGSMAVLEACAQGCPVICFDTPGQDYLPQQALLRVSIAQTYEETLHNFVAALLHCYRSRMDLATIGARAQDFVESEMTWSVKALKLSTIYDKLMEGVSADEG